MGNWAGFNLIYPFLKTDVVFCCPFVFSPSFSKNNILVQL